MKVLKIAASIIFILMALSSAVFAQDSTGQVNGTVTDPTGSAVPGALVKLINQSTKIEDQAKTNGNGYFTFVNVKPAPYILLVEMQGFKVAQVAQFNVGVAQTLTQNVTLSVG